MKSDCVTQLLPKSSILFVVHAKSVCCRKRVRTLLRSQVRLLPHRPLTVTIALKGNRPETKRQALKSLKFSADECSFTWILEVVKTTRVDLFAVVLIVHWGQSISPV